MMESVQPSLLSNPIGLWWVAVTCTLAATVTVVGALRGVSAHRVPRLMLGIAVAAAAFSYWWDLAGVGTTAGAEMRRGAGYVLWPALLWTAWSGITYTRNLDRMAEKVLGGDDE